MKVKILQDGMTKFTGHLGVIEFKDSQSVKDVSHRDAIRLSSIIGCVWEDGSVISKDIDYSKLEATPGRDTLDPEESQDTPVSNLWTAILHDQEGTVPDAEIVQGYKASAVKKAKEGYIAVTLEGTNLKEHQNSSGTKGHWIGFAVTPPQEDIDGVKVGFNDAALGEKGALEKNVHDGKDGVAVYVDHKTDGMPVVKATLQWMKSEDTVGDPVKYQIDTTKVKNYVAPIRAGAKTAITSTKRYTREELEAVADEKGIQGLREIGDPLGIKATSIRKLIDEIYSAVGK